MHLQHSDAFLFTAVLRLHVDSCPLQFMTISVNFFPTSENVLESQTAREARAVSRHTQEEHKEGVMVAED